jgi:hypothetical protein
MEKLLNRCLIGVRLGWVQQVVLFMVDIEAFSKTFDSYGLFLMGELVTSLSETPYFRNPRFQFEQSHLDIRIYKDDQFALNITYMKGKYYLSDFDGYSKSFDDTSSLIVKIIDMLNFPP